MYGYENQTSEGTERERLILEHLPQVHLIARRIHERLPGHVVLEDLISTGIVGLISAVDNFDPSANVQLRTYAEHKIRGAILDSLRELDWAPRDVRKKAKQIQRAIIVAQQRLRREPDEEEIAAELKISLEQYQHWLTETQGIDLSELEYAPADQPGRNLLKFVSDNEDRMPSRVLERVELEQVLATGIQSMPSLESTVLSLYYEQELTLREIAEITGIHISRVSQIKGQALLRLRGYVERRWTLPSGGENGNALSRNSWNSSDRT